MNSGRFRLSESILVLFLKMIRFFFTRKKKPEESRIPLNRTCSIDLTCCFDIDRSFFTHSSQANVKTLLPYSLVSNYN